MNRVLFVDSEMLTLSSLKRGLVDEPYQKFFATSGEDALKILKRHTISVLVTAMKMPGMNGLDLLKEVKDTYPDIVKIVLSGYLQLPQVLVTVNQGDIFRYMTKPYNLEDEFRGTITEAVDSYNLWVGRRLKREDLEKKNETISDLLKKSNDNVSQMNDEIEIILELNNKWQQKETVIMESWNSAVFSKEEFLRDMTSSLELVSAAFKLIPTQVKHFSSKEILNYVLANNAAKSYLKRVDYGINGDAVSQMRGRYELIVFLVNNIIDWAFEDKDDTLISLVVSSASQEESKILLTVVLEANETHFSAGITIESVMEWLQELASKFGVELVKREFEGQRALVLNMVCEG